MIDDDASIRAIVDRYLKATEWGFVSFESGLDGLSYLASTQPDVLLLDIRMPLIDGDQILEQLSSSGVLSAETRIFVMSSVAPPRSVWQKFERFGAAFVLKDVVYDRDSFLAAIAGSG